MERLSFKREGATVVERVRGEICGAKVKVEQSFGYGVRKMDELRWG
jgi:hypothetical protein